MAKKTVTKPSRKRDQIHVRQVGDAALQPLISDVGEWLAKMDRPNAEPSFTRGREQPKAPRHRIFG